jgi:hypothetical protein
VLARVLALLAAVALLAGCTSSGADGGPSATIRAGSPTLHQDTAPVDTGPVETGPTRAARAPSCPFAGTAFVRDTMGMRLGRITVLRSGGRAVGCRFYALQNSPLHTSEHLPGPGQPVVEITTARFRSALAAHNALARLGTAGRNPQQVRFGATLGLCFQTDFYPKDRGRDWACAASLGTLEVVVRGVDTTGSFSTAQLMKTVLRRA